MSLLSKLAKTAVAATMFVVSIGSVSASNFQDTGYYMYSDGSDGGTSLLADGSNYFGFLGITQNDEETDPLSPGFDQFTDTFSFSVATDTAVKVQINELVIEDLPVLDVLFDIEGSTATGSVGSFSGTGLPIDFVTGVLTAGTVYNLTIVGDATGLAGGDYTGSITAVPVPAAAWLFGSALIGLAGMSRRRNQRALYA